jgi:hypothetical protein
MDFKEQFHVHTPGNQGKFYRKIKSLNTKEKVNETDIHSNTGGIIHKTQCVSYG